MRRFAAGERSESGRWAERLSAWGPAATWAAVLFLLSAWSTPVVPLWLRSSDKVAHAGLYSVLGLCLGWGRCRSSTPPAHVVLIGLGALYAATDEWHQAFVPRRSPDLGDWIADVVGVTLGYTVMLVLLGWLWRRAKPKELGVDV